MEKDEAKKIRMRQQILRKGQNTDIVDKIVENIEKLSDKYLKRVDPAIFDEVSRRFSMLTRPFVVNCFEKVNRVFQSLKIQVPSALVAARTIRSMEVQVLIIPRIGNSKCEFVRAKVAGIISNIMLEIGEQRVSHIRYSISRYSNIEEKLAAFSYGRHVVLDESEEIIGQSPYNEFIGVLPKERVSILETYVSIGRILLLLYTEVHRTAHGSIFVCCCIQLMSILFSVRFKQRDSQKIEGNV